MPRFLSAPLNTRIISFDVLRGFCLISMICFHACFDMQGLFGVDIPWFSGMVQDVWRAQIAWTFLILAGIMCAYTTHPLKRSVSYAGSAAIIWLISSSDMVDMPISYGIMFCMALSSASVFLIRKLIRFSHGIMWACLFGVLFIVCLHVQDGYIGLKLTHAISATWNIPPSWYTQPFSAPLGFPPTTFSSWDYYPVIPFSFLFFAGASLADTVRTSMENSHIEAWMCAHNNTYPVRCLSYVGRHSLIVYMLHQPILFGLLTLLQLGAHI